MNKEILDSKTKILIFLINNVKYNWQMNKNLLNNI